MTKIKKVYTGGGITLAEAELEGGRYAVVSTECPELIAVYNRTEGSTSRGYSKIAFHGCSSLTIYCEAASIPSGWHYSWNYSNRPVVWGYTG